MSLKNKTIAFLLFISILLQFLPFFASAQAPTVKKIEKATLRISLDFSENGKVAITVRKLNPKSYEPEEMARLLSAWFCKINYILPSIMPRMFLLNEAQESLFEPKLRFRDDVLKKAGIDDVVKIVNNLERAMVVSSIDLYLQELPSNKRGLVSHLSRNVTEQHTVFSWAVILQYATQKYGAKDIDLIHDIMGETITAYSGGADPDAVENTVIIPNNAYLRVKVKD